MRANKGCEVTWLRMLRYKYHKCCLDTSVFWNIPPSGTSPNRFYVLMFWGPSGPTSGRTSGPPDERRMGGRKHGRKTFKGWRLQANAAVAPLVPIGYCLC